MQFRVCIALLLACIWPPLLADDMRPAALTVTALDATEFAVTWKVPVKNDRRLALDVDFDSTTVNSAPKRAQRVDGAIVESWHVRRDGGFSGMEIRIDGLSVVAADVLVRVIQKNGETITAVLNADTRSYQVPMQLTAGRTAITYTRLGVEHILAGWDHLLFVLCLVFVARSGRKLFWCITGFTIAHSVTLVAASLDWVRVPIAPVEAVIALSIVFLAVEIIKNRQQSLSLRYPAAVSSSFGLLHGFGFASVLADIGLPANEKLLALLSFNLGVEVGQLIFVAALYLLWRIASMQSRTLTFEQLRMPLGYGCGVIAMVWLVERLAAF